MKINTTGKETIIIRDTSDNQKHLYLIKDKKARDGPFNTILKISDSNFILIIRLMPSEPEMLLILGCIGSRPLSRETRSWL